MIVLQVINKYVRKQEAEGDETDEEDDEEDEEHENAEKENDKKVEEELEKEICQKAVGDEEPLKEVENIVACVPEPVPGSSSAHKPTEEVSVTNGSS